VVLLIRRQIICASCTPNQELLLRSSESNLQAHISIL
jgi:hypothetical protein